MRYDFTWFMNGRKINCKSKKAATSTTENRKVKPDDNIPVESGDVEVEEQPSIVYPREIRYYCCCSYIGITLTGKCLNCLTL